MRIVLLGNIGVGKGTQAKRIARAFDIPHISTGDIFRKHIADGSEIGKQVKGCLDSGRLVPDELVCQIVADRTSEPDCAHGYILDGFPRSLPQAEAFERTLDTRETGIDTVILLGLEDEEIIARLGARRSCPECGAVYNLEFSPPANDEKCDNPECGGAQLVQRPDDRPETVKERIKVYNETTLPIVSYYEARGLLHTVDASGLGPDAVFDKIEPILTSIREANV